MFKIAIPNNYPNGIQPPDISQYANGNTGIPYVWSFEGSAPGPHVMISALVQGNEPAGAVALDWLFKKGIKLKAGRMTLAFMNVDAYRSFLEGSLESPGWIDEDMDSVWDSGELDSERTSAELRRARQVRPILDEVDFLLDIHSTQHPAHPMMVTGRHRRAIELTLQLGIPERVVTDTGYQSGRRLRDYSGFDDPRSNRTALLIECGQHMAVSAGQLARASSLRFLQSLNMVDASLEDRFFRSFPEQKIYSLDKLITVLRKNLRFAKTVLDGEVVSKAGTVIAHAGSDPIVTPYDDAMLVMQTQENVSGEITIGLARKVEIS